MKIDSIDIFLIVITIICLFAILFDGNFGFCLSELGQEVTKYGIFTVIGLFVGKKSPQEITKNTFQDAFRHVKRSD